MMKRRRHARLATILGTRARRAARTRDEIVRAGLKVFSQKGFHGATMDDIALELDATKGLVYYYFNTKEDILAAIVANNPLTVAVENLVAAVKEVPMREALRDAFKSVRKLLNENRQLVRFLHVQAALSQEEAKVVYSEIREKIYRSAAELIEKSKGSGDTRTEINSAALAKFVVDFLTGEFISDSDLIPEHQRDVYAEQVIDVLINGIATPQARESDRALVLGKRTALSN
ncbi:MAG TPA: helix-turn-helix domain-containing protein [Candidatus Binataceae bacterium]|nr:helix-turn-helix domain-containing protein [Candidatus Binataceae bacterium]